MSNFLGSLQIVLSPSGEEYIYERCEAIREEALEPYCVGNSNIVIYNVQQQEIIGNIEHRRPPPPRPVNPTNYFSWSHSGRYIAYLSSIERLVGIYDTVSTSYVDLSFANSYPNTLTERYYGIRWLPDETKLVLWINELPQGSETYQEGIAIFDLASRTFRVTAFSPDDLPQDTNAWAWTPDGQHLLVLHNDGQLVQVDLEGNEQVVAENVNALYAWYPTIDTIPTPTPTITLTPTPTASNTPTPTTSSPLASFVVLGKEGVWLEQNSTVVSGDVGANIASSGPFLAEGSEVTVGIGVEFLTPASRVLGDSVFVKQGGQVYDVYYNEIGGQGQILGQQFTPLTLPLVEAFPTVPSFSAGTQNFDVAQNGTLTLDAGSYGTLKLRQGATVTFMGGVYNFQEWDLGLSTNTYFAASSEIRIVDRLKVEQGSYVGPTIGTTLDATEIIFYVNGQNGSSGNLGGAPKAAHFGINNTLIATVYAPNGTLWIRQGSTARGAFLGRWVDIGIGVEVTLESGF